MRGCLSRQASVLLGPFCAFVAEGGDRRELRTEDGRLARVSGVCMPQKGGCVGKRGFDVSDLLYRAMQGERVWVVLVSKCNAHR